MVCIGYIPGMSAGGCVNHASTIHRVYVIDLYHDNEHRDRLVMFTSKNMYKSRTPSCGVSKLYHDNACRFVWGKNKLRPVFELWDI